MAVPEFDYTFRPTILSLRWCGLWLAKNHSIAYKVYGFLLIIAFSVLLTLPMLIQMIAFTDVSNLTDSMYMALTELALFIKIVNFYVYNDSMQQQMRTAQNFLLETYAEIKLFKAKMRFIYRITIVLFVSVNVAQFSTEIKTLATPGTLFLFPASYPASWLQGGAKYWLAYGHQTIGAIITSNLSAALEAFTCAMLIMVSTQMEILGMRLQSLGHVIDFDSTGTKTGLKSRNTSREQLDQITKYIQLHQQITKLEFPPNMKSSLLIWLLFS